jgi:hypothetical protein
MLQATNCVLAHAAPPAAEKVRPSSVQAGPAIISASIRFRPTSATKADATMTVTPRMASITVVGFAYLGLAVLGWGGPTAFFIGVLLVACTIPPPLARIRSEGTLLKSQFGDEYEIYRARTSRLIPWLYYGRNHSTASSATFSVIGRIFHLLNNPIISAFASVLKCKLKPTTAADVSAFTSSLSVFTANTVNK